MGCSAYYHLTQIVSPRWWELMRRLDYGGIAVLIMGSSYPPIVYMFSCGEIVAYRKFFLALITTTSAICFAVATLEFFAQRKYRAVRGIMFIVLGLSAGIPIWFQKHLLRPNPIYLAMTLAKDHTYWW